ncbi:hypothetical protein F4677DRAFT_462972 [Hypoxylon crocopeplum]|nr:hypothetical protein F4677DRAFT_462972 [Hypoxylon crocopeplum]
MSEPNNKPPPRPVPFRYTDDDPRNLPDLDDDEFGDLTAVLKALAKGNYPRLDAVPLALNAYNCNRRAGSRDEPWSYFHPVTIIQPEDVPRKGRPVIDFEEEIINDLEKPWQPIRNGGNQLGQDGGGGGGGGGGNARYRFLCFIHKHRIDRRPSAHKGVHTISIWDREWDELTWHDTYPIARESRRREIRTFWSRARAPGLIEGSFSREDFLSRIRYRTAYHACERIEEALREAVPPRQTLYAVLGAALFHMEGAARDPQVSIVPDRLDLFGGGARALLPRLFAHLLRLCLDCRPAWPRVRQEAFVKQLRILERLKWMKVRTREYLDLRQSPGPEGGGGGDSGDSDSSGSTAASAPVAGDSRDWIYDVLKI